MRTVSVDYLHEGNLMPKLMIVPTLSFLRYRIILRTVYVWSFHRKTCFRTYRTMLHNKMYTELGLYSSLAIRLLLALHYNR
jgi:hypothetical protein